MKMKTLIEIAYLVIKKEIPFIKFGPIAMMEKRHGVELGQTDFSCADFVETIKVMYIFYVEPDTGRQRLRVSLFKRCNIQLL